jgi:hypothetical protein
MFQNIHFQSTYRPTQSPYIAFNSSTYNNYSTLNTVSSYSYTGHITALNTQIKNIAPSFINNSANRSFSNKRNNIYTVNDYAKISNLSHVADVFKQESSRSPSGVSATENNLAIGFQSTNEIALFSNSNPGDNPEGEPIPLSNDIPILFSLLATFIALKYTKKKQLK